jgi:hypothetical protein
MLQKINLSSIVARKVPGFDTPLRIENAHGTVTFR